MMDILTRAEEALERRDLDVAAAAFREAERQGNCADRIDSGWWTIGMLRGDFEAAWQASDRILARGKHDPQRFWMGESIQGRTVIVRSLHGLGDAVQMLRYAPMLKRQARFVTWQVPPNFVDLARRFDDVDHVITWEEPCEWELQVEITELPYLSRTTLAELPLASRYLTMFGMAETRTRPRIGLVWKAGEWNQSRSVPLEALEEILQMAGCDVISLQGGENTGAPACLQTIEPGLLTLAETIAGLDLVITVDTLAAHLAGALGTRAFVLLQYAADWRWMVGRDDSPWYPSLRLFRQPEPGDWQSPIQAVCKALETVKR